ncbi:MAG: glycosyltransferase family 2 protein [Bacteroidota bacterium]
MPSQLLSIIIPVFNEENTIIEVLDRIFSIQNLKNVEMEIIVINDGSTDATKSNLETYISRHTDRNISIKNFEKNYGKGASVASGINSAKGDIIIIQDADLEYDPLEYQKLIQPIINGKADVVYGSRFKGSGPHRMIYFWHYLGNRVLTGLSNLLNNLNLSDMETCYKVFKADIIKSIHLKENGFGIEPEITAKIARIPGIRIYEVGIAYFGRSYEEGKKIRWWDGLWAVYCILKYRLFD